MPLLSIGGGRDRGTIQTALIELVNVFDNAKIRAQALSDALTDHSVTPPAFYAPADLASEWTAMGYSTTTDEATALIGAVTAFATLVQGADATPAIGQYAAQIRNILR